jgi:hypothetical protein
LQAAVIATKEFAVRARDVAVRRFALPLLAMAMFVSACAGAASPGPSTAPPTAPASGGAAAYGDVATDPTELTATVTDPPGIPCYTSSATAPVVKVFYVYQRGHPSGLVERAPQIREAVAIADLIYSMSAAHTGGIRHVRWKMASGCQLLITPVAVTGSFDLYGTRNYLVIHHLLKSNEKGLAFSEDGPDCGGLGQLLPDDQPGSANHNNAGTSFAMVAIQPCIQLYYNAYEWAAAWETLGEGAAHELAHTLGAVQRSAPHSTAAGHCYDGVDVMCYTDLPTTILKSVCQPTMPPLLDCRNDDYFSTNPKPGSYLAKHWNIANNRFLARTNASRFQRLPRPGVSIGLADGATVAIDGAVPLTTSTASDGVPIVGVSLAVNGKDLSASFGLPPAPTLSGGGADSSLVGQSVQLTATVYDALGRRATSAPVSVVVGPTTPPTGDPFIGGGELQVVIDDPMTGAIVKGPFDVTIEALNESVKMSLELWVNGRRVASTDTDQWTVRVDPAALGIRPGALVTVAAQAFRFDGTAANASIGLQYVP